MVKHNSKITEIDKLKSHASEMEASYKRVLADYQNQERRFKDSQTQIVKFANATLLEKLLLNIDSLELAQNHLKDAGLNMVINQLHETLEAEGLQLIKSDHQDFDPVTMDCTEVVPGPKNKVLETVAKGYFLFDKVLRPAKVIVGSGEKTK